MYAEARRGNGLILLLLFLLFMVAAASLPGIESVGRISSHAIERHGMDAIRAKRIVEVCPKENLRVKLCPRSKNHGPSLVYWCEVEGTRCPGMYVTLQGRVKTAFIKPCHKWPQCQ